MSMHIGGVFCTGKFFTLPYKGNSASLGSLYSAYDGTFFGGNSLWSEEQIKNFKTTIPHTSSELGIMIIIYYMLN